MSDEGPRLQIDEFKLPEEWMGQASLYHEWAVKLADATMEVNEAKAALDLRKAELDKDMRSSPEAYGLAKITEKVIDNQTPLHIKTEVQILIMAKHTVDILSAAVNAIDHRKTALVKIVDMKMRDWVAEPKASREVEEDVKLMERKESRKKGLKHKKKRKLDRDD